MTKRILVLVLAVLTVIGQATFAVGSEEGTEMKIKITAGGRTLTATLEDNPTSRALMEKLPLTLPRDVLSLCRASAYGNVDLEGLCGRGLGLLAAAP